MIWLSANKSLNQTIYGELIMPKFKTENEQLSDILKDIDDGKIQLPDFQRGWVWDDEHIRSLLTSIAREFPINAFLFWKTGSNFKLQTKPIENVEFDGGDPTPELLILDGQQRLTS